MQHPTKGSRRKFLSTLAMTASASLLLRPRSGLAAESAEAQVTRIVANTFGIDTHNHIDVPLTAAEMPGPDIRLADELRRSGLTAISMAFATDYQPGDPYDRFLKGMASMDRVLERNGMKRSLTPADLEAAHKNGQPAVIQAIEGAHFLQGRPERVEEAWHRGLRQFGLLHDSDASVPLGDVYTNPPAFGGLTPFGATVVRACNRLGILIDLAHADMKTTADALKISSRPILVSHTGLNTRLGNNPAMAKAMSPRLISKEQAKMIAASGGLVGVWTHLSDTPLEYAQNIRAMVDVIGIDHVCIGTDTKLTPPGQRPGGFHGPRPDGPRPDGTHPDSQPPSGPPPDGGHSDAPHPDGPGPSGPPPNGFRPGQHPHFGERTNEAWEGQKVGFYFAVVEAMLRVGFTPEEIGKIGGGNYLRVFAAALRA